MIENTSYIPVDLTGKETVTKNKIKLFVDSLAGETDDEKRSDYPKIKKMLIECIDYLQAHPPTGVSRVDGKSIRPLLNEVVNSKLSALPPVEEI